MTIYDAGQRAMTVYEDLLIYVEAASGKPFPHMRRLIEDAVGVGSDPTCVCTASHVEAIVSAAAETVGKA